MCAAKILFKLSGSIAAWKACAVISRLAQDGHEVQTVATPAALRFIGAATLEGLTGKAVKTDLWEAGTAMDHINLVKWADVVVLCPASANTINAFAAGLASDLVGALFLAHDWRKPYLLAPAMNPAMWAHPATAASLEKLRGWGVRVLPVGRGRLACGDEGEGRLLEPDMILDQIRAALPAKPGAIDTNGSAGAKPNLPPRVLITSGGTEEPIDGVRSIGNFSTGRTGALLADAFASAGCEVTLLRARRALAAENSAVRTEVFSSFADLEEGLRRLLAKERFDAVLHAAAVSDYSVAGLEVNGRAEPALATGKLDSGRDVAIRLKPNPKLIDSLRAWSANPRIRVVAFKLTRGADAGVAQAAVDALFAHSRADFVVHNDLSKLDEATGHFPATIHAASGEATPVESRDALAAALSAIAASPT
jgi:phosphopantothenoylcysteine decarboxylase / phosphopantothenate---cysteine ligase